MQILVSKRICGSSRTDYPKFVAFREQISGFTLMLDVPVTRDLAFSFGEDPLPHPGKTHIQRLTGSRGCALLLWSARPPHTPKFRTCRPPGGWATSVIFRVAQTRPPKWLVLIFSGAPGLRLYKTSHFVQLRFFSRAV